MSIASQALVWAHSQADGAALLALLCIADHDGDGGSWPSMDTIAQRARVTRDAARKIVRRLEERGEIVTDRNGGGGLRTAAHMRTNRYEITLECPPNCDRSARHRELAEPVDNTPQPTGGGPADGLGAPQPTGGANHPLNTLNPGNPVSRSGELHANETDSDSNADRDDYASWSPGQKIAEAARRAAEAEAAHQPVKRPDYSKGTGTSRATLPPAPFIPRYDPATEPPKPRIQSPEQLVMNEQAASMRCAAQGGKFNHFIPASMTTCARCNLEAAAILDQANQLEATA